MDNETNNTNLEMQETPTETPKEEEQAKTFTQDEVNRIVQERIARERVRLNGLINDDENIRMELNAERLKVAAIKELSQKGYPVDLVEFMDCSTEQTYKESLERLDKMYDMIYDKIIHEVFKAGGRQPRGGSYNTGTDKSEDRLKNAFAPKR